MDSNEKKLKKLLSKLDAPSLDENDIKTLCLAIISDIDGDTANHARVKIEALRLLKDVVVKDVKESNEMNNDSLLSILNGGGRQEKSAKNKKYD